MVEYDKIYNEDALSLLKRMDDNSIDCVVTSPPYYALRKYTDNDLEIGREQTPGEYIDNLVEVFQEVYRVLKPTGTVWVNIGDSYCGTGDKGDLVDPKDNNRNGQSKSINRKIDGLKRKDLIGIPWLFAFAMRDRVGFYLRQDIIWEKQNAMPESVTDRCVKSHEYIFLLTKSEKYYFDYKAIQEPAKTFENRPVEEITSIRFGGNKYGDNDDNHFQTYSGKEWKPQMKNLHRDGQTVQGMHKNRAEGGKDEMYAVRNKRDVWSVNTQPSPIEHCAMYPEKLIMPCILAGCPEGGIVYDPFMGSGTTALATIHALGKRKFIGSEISEKYTKIAQERAYIEKSQTTLF